MSKELKNFVSELDGKLKIEEAEHDSIRREARIKSIDKKEIRKKLKQASKLIQEVIVLGKDIPASTLKMKEKNDILYYVGKLHFLK